MKNSTMAVTANAQNGILPIRFGLDTIQGARNEVTALRKSQYAAYLETVRQKHEASLTFDHWCDLGCLTYDGIMERWGFGQKRNVLIGQTDDGVSLTRNVGRPRSTEPKTVKVQQTTVKGSRRIPAMFADGDVKVGDVVTVLKSVGKVENGTRDDFVATVVDAKNVSYNGTVMSWNEFGQKAIGHSAINVYVWLLINGTLLNDLR